MLHTVSSTGYMSDSSLAVHEQLVEPELETLGVHNNLRALSI